MAGQSLQVLPAELVRGIQQLEPLPLTAQRLLSLVNGENVSSAAIAELIEFDPAITAAVLRSASTVRYLQADARELAAHAKTHGMTFVDAERQLLGVDHAAVGAAMAEAWRFPTEIVDAIRRHHSPPFTDATVVLDAVTLGNAVAKTIGVGLGAEGLNLTVDNASYRRLGIDFTAYGRACLRTHLWLEEMTHPS